MAAKTLDSILGRHTEVIADFRRQLAAAQRPDAAKSELALRQKERLLASVEGRVSQAQEAREATIARLDESIRGLQVRAERLKAEIEADRQAVGPGGRPPIDMPPIGRPPIGRPPTDRPPVVIPGVRPPAGPVGPNLTDITGVGKAYKERLEAQGIRSPGDVAKMKPGQLAAALSISEARAKALVAAAKKVKK